MVNIGEKKKPVGKNILQGVIKVDVGVQKPPHQNKEDGKIEVTVEKVFIRTISECKKLRCLI